MRDSGPQSAADPGALRMIMAIRVPNLRSTRPLSTLTASTADRNDATLLEGEKGALLRREGNAVKNISNLRRHQRRRLRFDRTSPHGFAGAE